MEKLFLKDDEVKLLDKSNYAETINQVDAETQWVKVFYKEVQVVGLDNAPILLAEIKSELGLASRDDVIVSCMENAGVCLQLPVNNKKETVPVSTIGYTGLVTRAGFGGPALNYSESNKRLPMPPCDRAEVLNAGLSTFKDSEGSFGYALIRFDRNDAFHSSEYSILPVSELLREVEDSLEFNYSNWEFIDGSVSPAFTSLRWQIADSKIEAEIKKTLNKRDDFNLGMVLLTSDTGISSAKIYLTLQGKNGNPILIGRPQCMPHKNGNSAKNFGKCADALTSSVRDVLSLMQTLTQKKCLHVGGAIRLFANRLRLPKRFAMTVAADYEAGYPQGASFYEVFIALQDVIYLYQRDAENATPEKVFELSEAVSCILFIENMSEYDRNFEWADKE